MHTDLLLPLMTLALISWPITLGIIAYKRRKSTVWGGLLGLGVGVGTLIVFLTVSPRRPDNLFIFAWVILSIAAWIWSLLYKSPPLSDSETDWHWRTTSNLFAASQKNKIQ